MRQNCTQSRATSPLRWRIGGTAALIMAAVALSSCSLAIKAQDSAHGKDLFDRRCGGCHALDNDKEGPRLRGVFGRPAGSVSSFKYSDAFKNAHITWNAESLDKWLTDTEKVIPNNDMAFHVEKAEERRDIISYLKELSSK